MTMDEMVDTFFICRDITLLTLQDPGFTNKCKVSIPTRTKNTEIEHIDDTHS